MSSKATKPALAIRVLAGWATEENIGGVGFGHGEVENAWHAAAAAAPELQRSSEAPRLERLALIDRDYLRVAHDELVCREQSVVMVRLRAALATAAKDFQLLLDIIDSSEDPGPNPASWPEAWEEWLIYSVARSALRAERHQTALAWARLLQGTPSCAESLAIEGLCFVHTLDWETAIERISTSLAQPFPFARPWLTLLLGALLSEPPLHGFSQLERAWLNLVLGAESTDLDFKEDWLLSSLGFGAALRGDLEVADRL